MNCPQGPCALAGREQVLLAAALMADSAHRPVIEGAAREGGGVLLVTRLETITMRTGLWLCVPQTLPRGGCSDRHLLSNPRCGTLCVHEGILGHLPLPV